MSKRRNTMLVLSLLPLLVATGPIPRGNSTATNVSNLEVTHSPSGQNVEIYHMAPGPMIPDNNRLELPQVMKREEAIVLPTSVPSNVKFPPALGLMIPDHIQSLSEEPAKPEKRGEDTINPSFEASMFETPMTPPIVPNRVRLLSDQVKRDEAIILPSSAPSDTITIFPAVAGSIIPNEALPSPSLSSSLSVTENKRDSSIILTSSPPSTPSTTTTTEPKSKPNLIEIASQIDDGNLLEFLRNVVHASSEEEREKIVKESKYAEEYERLRETTMVGA